MKRIIFFLLAFILLLSSSLFAASSLEYQKQAQADKMAQNAIYYLWNDGDVKKAEKEFFNGITIQGKLDLSEAFF